MKNVRLRESIQLQVNAAGLSAHERQDNWATYATVWADKRDPKGEEVQAALQTRSVMTVTFLIRYRDDVTPQHRVLLGSRIFDIKAVSEFGHGGRWLILHCAEHQSDGD